VLLDSPEGNEDPELKQMIEKGKIWLSCNNVFIEPEYPEDDKTIS
jgi:hypothetical protein